MPSRSWSTLSEAAEACRLEGEGEAMASLIGTTVGKIRIVDQLSQGGMGEVYVGHDETLQRQVAVKVISGRLRLNPDARKRFIWEAQVLCKLEHANICRVYDFIQGDEHDFLIMELIKGCELTEEAEGMAFKAKLRIAEQVADALSVAHRRNIVHRDIKPDNVMITDDGRVKVLDFGLARSPGYRKDAAAADDADANALETPVALEGGGFSTQFGVVTGTPMYMSPEQARGVAVTTASDMYSFGLLLQWLFTGRDPHPRNTSSTDLMLRTMDGKSEPAVGIDSDLAALIKDLKSIAPESRPNAEEARARIQWISDRPARHMRRIALAAFIIVLVTGTVLSTVGFVRASREAVTSRRALEETQEVSRFLIDLFEVSNPGEARGNTVTARELLDQGAEKIRSGFQNQPLARARFMLTIGDVYQKLGLYEKAEPLLTQSLEISERELAPDHLDVAASLGSLGILYRTQGRYEEAEPLLQRALEIQRTALGNDDPKVARNLVDLGILYWRLGRHEEAESFHLRALEIEETALGPDHSEVASSLSWLGILYSGQGRYDEAEQFHKRALAIREKALGPDHPDLATSLNGLGILYKVQGRYDEAEQSYKRALAIWKNALGPNHPEFARSLNNLGVLFWNQERYEDAEPYYQRSLAIHEKTLGPDHPHVGLGIGNLGLLYWRQGQLEKAESYLRQSLAIFQEKLEPDHPWIGFVCWGLAGVYRDQGHMEKAEPFYQRALAIREKKLEAGHPDLITTLKDYAQLLRATDREAAAEELEARAQAENE